MRRMTAARARAASLLLPMLLAAACKPAETLPSAWSIPLPQPVAEGATLSLDSARIAWIGTRGRLAGHDSAGRVVATVTVSGDSVPRLLWRSGDRLVISQGPRRLVRGQAGGGRAAAGWSSSAMRAAARDPRGRWVFTANRRGGVVGLDPATLAPRWGWAETGGEAVGLAVSPLADRVYVSVDRMEDVAPAVQVRDAGSGRVLFAADQAEALRGLAAGPDGTLYGWQANGLVVRLRHGPQGLRRIWAETPPVRGPEGELAVRVDPSGRRVAVFGQGRGARLAVLDALTGRVLGQTNAAPLDAAFDVGGRLYLLELGELRVLR
ncbi:YncE family protein [Longimicrobium sp.]|uniref:YncE family protein n=1 Tax=Longimicrobium sp. TaxID=2029185 RepID=UPI003B3AA435